jgi:hypothetical protein
MTPAKDPRRIAVYRLAGGIALLVFLAIAAWGFSILGAFGAGVTAEQTGVGAGAGSQLEVHGERLSSAAFGDRFVFALRTAAGQVTPPSLPATFPVYPGAVIERSAVYADARRSLRGVLYRADARSSELVEWYRKALEAEGYRTLTDTGDVLEARRGDSLVRVQPDASSDASASVASPGVVSFGVFVSGL